jgi:hypothetical protein
MARARAPDSSRRRRRQATTPEAREIEISSQAYDLAEEQIRQGSASSQVITHFLKMGSTRERLEQAKIEHENELLQVKRQAIESQQRIEELYVDAIRAMKSYSGSDTQEDENDEPE